jgi:hypothetical protein
MEGIIRDVIGGGNLLASVYFLVIERADYGYCLVPIETRYLNQRLMIWEILLGRKLCMKMTCCTSQTPKRRQRI